MISDKNDAHCIQETWKLGDYKKLVKGYTIFHHNVTTRFKRSNRGCKVWGVAIIILWRFTWEWDTWNPSPRTIGENEEFEGWCIRIKSAFRRVNSFRKKIRGLDRIQIVSAYLSYNAKEQHSFMNILMSLLDAGPMKVTKIIGMDANADLGVRENE